MEHGTVSQCPTDSFILMSKLVNNTDLFYLTPNITKEYILGHR